MRKQYPRKGVEDLVDWLDDAKVLVDAGKLLGKVKAWDPESSDPDDLSDNRRQLFASREDILRCVNFSKDISKNAASLDEFLGGRVVIMDDVDCAVAKSQHMVWFTALQAATRHSTTMTHALQTQIADGAKNFLGSDVSTAASLTQQWALTDGALEDEERLLTQHAALQVVRECVRSALAVAEGLGNYLVRHKQDFAELACLPLLLANVGVFPELVLDDAFMNHFQTFVLKGFLSTETHVSAIDTWWPQSSPPRSGRRLCVD